MQAGAPEAPSGHYYDHYVALGLGGDTDVVAPALLLPGTGHCDCRVVVGGDAAGAWC